MSKLWNDYGRRILDPDTPPEEADKLCAILVEMAARGDEEAERAIAALACRFIGDPRIPRSLLHHVSLMFAFRAQGIKWERAARYRKYNTLDALIPPKEKKKIRRSLDERVVIDAVKLAKSIGYPLSGTSSKSKKTAFEIAAEILEERWRDEYGRARGGAGTMPTHDNVRYIWYRHHSRKSKKVG